MWFEYNGTDEHLTQKYFALLLSVCFTQYSLFHILQSSQRPVESMACTSTCVLEYNARFTISDLRYLTTHYQKIKTLMQTK